MLESDNEYYNRGIVDVSHKYEEMYVVRPQFFIPIITLLRNAAINSLKYKRELAVIRNQNIDIYTSPMTRYKGLAYTTQYGYRVVEIDENDTSTYKTRVERLYDVFDFDYIDTAEENGDQYSKRIAFELAVKGKVQKAFLKIWQSTVELFTDRTVSYPDQ